MNYNNVNYVFMAFYRNLIYAQNVKLKTFFYVFHLLKLRIELIFMERLLWAALSAVAA